MPTLQLATLELPFSPSTLVFSRCFLLALVACLILITLHRFLALITSRKYSLPTVSTITTSDKTPKQSLPNVEATPSVIESKGAINSPSSSSSSPSSSISSSAAIATAKKQSKWTWGWFTWESLPVSLPVSLRATETHNRVIGQGVGVSVRNAMQSVRRGAPIFEGPVPAIYQTEVPVSMAKMIMSRHTFRRPNGARPPPPTNSTVPVHPSSRRNCSTMV
ncbi:hypothetical protein BDN72DRAFT_460131 [Pluteus cervinus]|uniref:Uncharacterized protein n=1 Tax=Pluteus cervinus TaxID=181527 RepID=A0ACD3A725_9AGAR|nr:hypothetical protein BDN72DRAFT_460131 [Pluteus cervinus]